MPHWTQRSREATPGVLSDVSTHSGREGIKGGKKMLKQCLQGAVTMTGHDDGNDGEAGGSGKRRISIVAHHDKHQGRPPIDHFKRLLEEAYPNHAYPIRHRLKDYGMIRSFKTSRSLTWGAELDEGPDGSDTMPFPRENTVLTVYVGCPPLGRCRVSILSPSVLTHCGWGHGGSGV
jgi:hypothetical protein